MKVTLNLFSYDKACALGLQIAHIYLYLAFFAVSLGVFCLTDFLSQISIKFSQYLINVFVVGNEIVETQVQLYVLIVLEQAPKTIPRTMIF